MPNLIGKDIRTNIVSKGTVFWLTGLSGSGKTAIGEALTEKLQNSDAVIFLDGDRLREVYGNMLGYSKAERRNASLYYARLCKMISVQGINVVCATISMIHQTQEWNRNNIEKYLEIYVRVPIEELILRDNKQIYSRAKSGKLTNVVGMDIEAEEPQFPDLIIDNYGDMTVNKAVNRILETLY